MNEDVRPSEGDRHFVEQQIRAHVDLAQWNPDPHVLDASAECWQRAFVIARLQQEGVRETSEIARRLATTESQVEEDRVLTPYLDRTIAGLLAVLGWHFDSRL